MKIKILIPIYNDWQSVFKLLENIDSDIANLEEEISVVIVNDGSREQRSEINFNLNKIKSVQVINMKENRGHARCNAAGLKYINEKEDFGYGTKALLEAVAASKATTIVSGGHLSSALKKFGLAEKITHISTAGGALVRYLTATKLPMIKALEESAEKYKSKK